MKPHHRDTVIVAILAFTGGVIFAFFHIFPFAQAYVLLGKEWVYGWAGALATAAIGLAANRIARTAHRAKEQDGYLQKLRDFESDTTRWTKLRSNVIACRLAYASYELIVRQSPTLFRTRPKNAHVMRRVLLPIRKLLPDGRLARTDVPVSDETHILLESLDMGLVALTVSIDEFLAAFPSSGTPATRYSLREFIRIIKATKEILSLAEKVGPTIDDLRPVEPTASADISS